MPQCVTSCMWSTTVFPQWISQFVKTWNHKWREILEKIFNQEKLCDLLNWSWSDDLFKEKKHRKDTSFWFVNCKEKLNFVTFFQVMKFQTKHFFGTKSIPLFTFCDGWNKSGMIKDNFFPAIFDLSQKKLIQNIFITTKFRIYFIMTMK